jgi:hypothetical protein
MPGNFVKRRIVELVRADARAVMALADLGISPRYVYWTLEEAAADLQLSLDRVIRRFTELAPAAATLPVA